MTGSSTGSLLIVTGDMLGTLVAKGQQPPAMQRYYNPAACFAQTRFFNWQQEAAPEAFAAQMVQATPAPGIAAWRSGLGDISIRDVVSGSEMLAGWPGLPAQWLQAARDANPVAVRAYDADAAGQIGLELARAMAVPCLVSVHNVRGIAANVVAGADVVMCVSDAVAFAAVAAGADPARVVTVPNRVDRQVFTPQGPAAQGPAGSPRLLCIARDVEQKNLDRLLAACEQARLKQPGLTLVHAGKSARDWSRWPFVTHFDAIPHAELPNWLRWADAFVLPSLWEGFGIVFAEALACGVPVVTSRRAPMNAIVTDQWDGLLCDPESVADIARAICDIAEPATRARLAAPARTASEPYDIAVVEARESALYSTLTQPHWPKVSVVLPTFNRAGLIEAAIANVLDQNYPNLELIVVNDGSRDATRQVLDQVVARRNDPRLRVLHFENAGLPTALNRGFEAATGDLWTWTSDDNAYRPGALQAMARELMLDTSLAMVFADYEVRFQDGSRKPTCTGPVSELATRNVVGACFLYRAEVARQVGVYDPGRKLAEDWDYWLRMSKVGRIGRLARVLYDYGDTPDSLTRTRPAEVLEAAMAIAGTPAHWDADYHAQMVRLAGAYKWQGLAWRSLRAACSIVSHRPLSVSGYKALLRAVTPMPLLRLGKRLRGGHAN
ncbi:MAG: glycosyltransferase [Planctomycetes bacterium]|nr:glycosyltransferase [Planctomycetota bacterium]